VDDFKLEDRLCDFIKDFGDDLCSLELVLFFGRHPHARFNRTAVIHALNSGRFDCGGALKRLIDRKLVVTCLENGMALYALTKEEPAHSIVIELKKIDLRQWQTILEQILAAQGISEDIGNKI
jgi:hypothetical protein